jgi:hypothetical protein
MGRLSLFWDFPIFRFNTNIKEKTWRKLRNNFDKGTRMVLNNSVFEPSNVKNYIFILQVFYNKKK